MYHFTIKNIYLVILPEDKSKIKQEHFFVFTTIYQLLFQHLIKFLNLLSDMIQCFLWKAN